MSLMLILLPTEGRPGRVGVSGWLNTTMLKLQPFIHLGTNPAQRTLRLLTCATPLLVCQTTASDVKRASTRQYTAVLY